MAYIISVQKYQFVCTVDTHKNKRGYPRSAPCSQNDGQRTGELLTGFFSIPWLWELWSIPEEMGMNVGPLNRP